jgi:hypothetical protein
VNAVAPEDAVERRGGGVGEDELDRARSMLEFARCGARGLFIGSRCCLVPAAADAVRMHPGLVDH